MATSVLSSNERTSCHSRKISLPPTSHPLGGSVEDHLQSLRASSTECGSSSLSLCSELTGIKDLYQQLNGLIQLPLNQQVLAQEIHQSAVEGILDGFLALLDICGTTLDLFSQMKTSIQTLESSLRRRSGKECAINAYMASRKEFIKRVSKCLVTVKIQEKNRVQLNDSSLISTVNMLMEAEFISISAMRQLLHFVCGAKSQNSQKGLSLVVRLKQSKQVSCDQKFSSNEVEVIDRALDDKKFNLDAKDVNDLLKQLETMEATFTEFEDCLQSISRSLVKTRVSLLNVLTY